MKRLVAAVAIVVAILGGGTRSASARDWVFCADEGGSAVPPPAPSSTTAGAARLPTGVARRAASLHQRGIRRSSRRRPQAMPSVLGLTPKIQRSSRIRSRCRRQQRGEAADEPRNEIGTPHRIRLLLQSRFDTRKTYGFRCGA